MNIKATETHRLNGKPHIRFTNADTGEDLYPGGRYVGAAWDTDPEAVIADAWSYIQASQAAAHSLTPPVRAFVISRK